jgi:iron complex transport system ATP-binding protein
VERALTLTGTTAIRDRRLDELSGGQRQRAWIALALAQETPLLLHDEPTTNHHHAHQVEVQDHLHRLNREEGRTIVLVIHDLNLAARYADHLVAMAAGEVCAAGEPAEVLTEALMRDVFGLESRVITDPTCGAPLVLPIARTAPAPTGIQPVTDHPEARPSS